MRARLCGFSSWTPGPDAAKPDASLLPSRLRRRTALLTRMACHVVERAAREAEADLSKARLILSSAWGEFETTIQLLEQLAEPAPQVSPTLFHNSVHNTATGYLSIALDNREGSTAIGAGTGSLRVGLIEAMAELAVDGGEVLLVVGDEQIPRPFVDSPGDPVAVGLCLRPIDAPRRGGLDIPLRLHRQSLIGVPGPGAEIPPSLADNPCARVLDLARAVASGAPAKIALEEGEHGWLLELGGGENT